MVFTRTELHRIQLALFASSAASDHELAKRIQAALSQAATAAEQRRGE